MAQENQRRTIAFRIVGALALVAAGFVLGLVVLTNSSAYRLFFESGTLRQIREIVSDSETLDGGFLRPSNRAGELTEEQRLKIERLRTLGYLNARNFAKASGVTVHDPLWAVMHRGFDRHRPAGASVVVVVHRVGHDECFPRRTRSTGSGTIDEMSPPNRAISRMRCDARNDRDDADGMNNVWTPEIAWFI